VCELNDFVGLDVVEIKEYVGLEAEQNTDS
jgi:hypothetical protein